MKGLLLFMCAWLFLADTVIAQNCPVGIPSAGNPMCIPPDRPESPYYNGSSAYIQQASQPKMILIKQRWADRWGAIASDGIAGALGFVTGYKTKEIAINAALDKCKEDGGKNCRNSISFYNQCAVFIVGDKKFYSQGAKDIATAKKIAMEKCHKEDDGCRLYKSGCSMAEVETE